jgi:hypothetical protein
VSRLALHQTVLQFNLALIASLVALHLENLRSNYFQHNPFFWLARGFICCRGGDNRGGGGDPGPSDCVIMMRSAVMLQLTCSHVRPDHGSHLVPVQPMVNMVRASDRIHCDKTTKRYSCCGQYDSCETMFQIPIAVWIPVHNDRGITQCRARRAAFARRVQPQCLPAL